MRAELTSFVGKDADVAAVRELIAGHRLTTVIGPGGSGKTRLATETARTLLGDLPDGAWLVELAPISGSGDVAQLTLAALGLRDALLGGAPNAEPMDRLIAAIREREMLLILDNCEHVIESAAAFAYRVLGEGQRLRILATSREPLGITGEALWQVEPLALPAEDADPGEIESSPAVRLLQDRAGEVRRNLGPGARTLSNMARVCRALDGIPLAIELAAARLRTMSLDQLAYRLDDRFRLLTGGSRTALPQHRTLRAVVDWSWELLTDAERMVLRRLAVFSGGASLDAAEQVCGGDSVERREVLELLTALAEKSLLLTDQDSAPRYRMLDTIKEYARDRLAEAGESDLARHAHLAYFTGLAETADPHLRRAEQLEWLATLEAEHDNIGSALRGALAAGEAHGAMRLAAAAGWYWWLGGHKAEGIELITAAANAPGEVSDEIRATVYALVVMFMTDGPADQYQAAEWIHQAYRFAQRSQPGHPALAFVAPLERMLQGPHAFSARVGSAARPTTTRGCAHWPGCSSARCGSCSARAGGMWTRISSWRWPNSGRSASGGGSRSLCGSWRIGSPRAASSPARASCTNRRLRWSPRSAPAKMWSRCGRGGRSCTGCWVMRSRARPPWPRPSGTRNGSRGRLRWPSWPWPRRSWLAGAATPSRPTGNSASRRPCWATKRSRQTSAR